MRYGLLLLRMRFLNSIMRLFQRRGLRLLLVVRRKLGSRVKKTFYQWYQGFGEYLGRNGDFDFWDQYKRRIIEVTMGFWTTRDSEWYSCYAGVCTEVAIREAIFKLWVSELCDFGLFTRLLATYVCTIIISLRHISCFFFPTCPSRAFFLFEAWQFSWSISIQVLDRIYLEITLGCSIGCEVN